MITSACLTCHNARKGDLGIGQVKCLLDGETYNVMHVCFAFEHINKNLFLSSCDSSSEGSISSCSVSTTATNSHQWEKPTKKDCFFTPATDSHGREKRGEI